ncbi:hypothetical protein AUJ14_06270 [Candidatus Micrarchaeota archaeon CG1_02_55_22]|nr:MAG: hypothetical protein AUJ14_06270 [Candidatus Micrarchaeota archaeon CG1_02_55_22]
METFANVPTGEFSNYPLHNAARKGNVDEVRRLLEAGHDANELGENNWTPMHHAATGTKDASDEAHRKIIDLLVKHGADLNARDHEQETPLHKAAYSGRYRLFLRLHALGADHSAVTRKGDTPLHTAAVKGSLAAAAALLRLGADVHALNNDGKKPHEAGDGRSGVVKMLKAHIKVNG